MRTNDLCMSDKCLLAVGCLKIILSKCLGYAIICAAVIGMYFCTFSCTLLSYSFTDEMCLAPYQYSKCTTVVQISVLLGVVKYIYC